MALLDRIAVEATRRDAVRAADPVSLEEFGKILASGRTAQTASKAGTMVGARRALGITAWYSGARYLAEGVAGLPWHHFARMGEDSRMRRAPQEWLATPDLDQTWYGIVEFVVMSLLHEGNAFAFKLRNTVGQVVGLREIHPCRVTGGIAPDGSKRFLVDKGTIEFTTREILHIPGLAYDGRYGLNPIRTFADSLGAVAAADDYAGRFFSSGSHMGGVITVPQVLKPGERESLRQEWDEFHAGLLNAHRTGVLSKGAEYNRISLNAADAQLLETRQFGIAEVARMLRIPPHKLYDLTRATFSNIEHQAIEAVTDSIRPWVIRIENAINADADLVLPGHYVEASLDGLLRGDAAGRAAAYSAGITGGWLTPGSVARKENEPAPPELDYYLRPLNMDVIHPGVPAAADDGAENARAVAEILQKVYLAVGAGVITEDEGRAIANQAGAQLPVPGPKKQGGA